MKIKIHNRLKNLEGFNYAFGIQIDYKSWVKTDPDHLWKMRNSLKFFLSNLHGKFNE